MIFQQITAKAQRLIVTSVAVLVMASCAAAAAKYDTSIARDEWYGTTLQGMAARKLYYCGIIDGIEANPSKITDDLFALDRPLSEQAAQIILSRCTDVETAASSEENATSRAITEEEFLNLLGDDEHDSTLICPHGNFTRGHAFEILAEKVDAHNYDAGRKPFNPPHRIMAQAQTAEDALTLVERGFSYGAEQIEIRGPKEVLHAVNQLYEENDQARHDNNYDKLLLNDKYEQYYGSIPSSWLRDDCVDISVSAISEYVYLHLDREDWLLCKKDRDYSKVYNDFMQNRILPLKEKCSSTTELIQAVSDVISAKASYAYHYDLLDWAIHSLEGFFDNGKIVCDGYAEVFRACMYELDIPCVIVTNEDWSHAWNKVYTGDRWLHVDVCWSDTGYGSRAILKTDKEIVALGGHNNPSYCGAAYSNTPVASIDIDELGAINYLSFLRRNPEQALKTLKAGLPRK